MSFDENEFLYSQNAEFIEKLYHQYLNGNDSIPSEWLPFFKKMGPPQKGQTPTLTHPQRPSSSKSTTLQKAPSKTETSVVSQATLDSIRASMMIRAYRVRGHLYAQLDPLGLSKPEHHSELDPQNYGFTEQDYDREIYIDNMLGRKTATLREILGILEQTYCASVGIEFLHIQSPAQKSWIQERIENTDSRNFLNSEQKKKILQSIIDSQSLEKFLHKKFVGTKRFGLDGAESLIPLLEVYLERSAELGIESAVLGMAHRGRLNVLANILNKPIVEIISEFHGNGNHAHFVQGSGDVKYHLGTSSDRKFGDHKMHLSLTANPSHLEAVDPVVMGKVRGKQFMSRDLERSKTTGLLIHGDAAFAGQGLVAETLDLSELNGYRTGGTLHLIINNQIGFTTCPSKSRSSPYSSDIAKGIQAPIFHVNGDDPEAVAYIAQLAAEFRHHFKKDVIIDMFCYRRFGHNEADEPSFTQPLMYKAIAKHPSVREIYEEKLRADSTISTAEISQYDEKNSQKFDKAFKEATKLESKGLDWLKGEWSHLESASKEFTKTRGETAVPLELLRKVGHAISREPTDIHFHPKLKRILEQRKTSIDTGTAIDWSMAEALAFGTLLCENTPIRLSGQDSARGTFSQRHAVLIDQQTEEEYVPLNHIQKSQAHIEIVDSPLAEASVLGFEYGYSSSNPHSLTLWEAQFGDFSNGAQLIIDQFISSGERKWFRMSGLVMLLPHGYEGQGPEHSSARLERFLQLCAEDNIQVINCSTPANYFHVLRRQVRRKFRKPLVLMTPKSLLRHKSAKSTIQEMAKDTSFERIYPDTLAKTAKKDVRRIILCSGKVYYDLEEGIHERGLQDIAIIRVEQLYPFPNELLTKHLKESPQAQVVWCQEEPQNMGAWTYIDRRLEKVMNAANMKEKRPVYVGRPEAASPATGLMQKHLEEQRTIANNALVFDEALSSSKSKRTNKQRLKEK
ncbi:MAG: 2-oxoglutarate dehydrogenase E1 component [Alphaproteobacteria bacterium]|jgi:2-oxoglutarate dehydrogenase E1 component|nr:2-oxoglutarate dehydrogenase E1 component [Alphaproteobacteria bacterium]MBT5390110.1 2-oxoglutarate dehydrogenase E1 component [Alphaproteobacteria bacterium]MBT5539996.1 2-oxoglutarate dehydrogenase E1 component [Alphaproteobacteria bacterium]MBT5654665.1 2-oxoglutarate dehydrogenase E1 component [Alphaproteobacteria bacterium]